MVVEPKDIKHRGKKAKNNREFFRLNERLKIYVKLTKKPEKDEYVGEIDDEKYEKSSEHYTSDISAGGMQFFSKGFYKENTHVEISMHFKRTEPLFDPITVNAIILRSEQIENSLNYNVSVKFVNIDSKDRAQLERYIFIRQRELIAEKKIGFL